MKHQHQAPELEEVSNIVICVSRFSSLNWRCEGKEAAQSCAAWSGTGRVEKTLYVPPSSCARQA